MRLFLAITLDRPAEAQLARRLLDLQTAIGTAASALRWTPAGNVHVTLHFLGEIEASRLAHLREGLGASLAEAPCEVALGGFGALPLAGAPRVIWLDVIRGRASLARIHDALGRRLAAAGFPIESRALSPHVTVARVPDRGRAQVGRLREQLASIASEPIVWIADRVTLFRSDLSGLVPRYDSAHEIELTA